MIDILFFIYLFHFLLMLGLCCCMQAFSSCREREYSPDALYRLLIAVVSLVVEHRL